MKTSHKNMLYAFLAGCCFALLCHLESIEPTACYEPGTNICKAR